MAALTVGQICMKISGRESGKYCVIIGKEKDNFVTITGPKEITGVKRRRCNIFHLEPVAYSIEIKENAEDVEVSKAFESSEAFSKLKIKKPTFVKKSKTTKVEKKVKEKPKK